MLKTAPNLVIKSDWRDQYKLAGECRDLNNTLLGRYVFLWHPKQQDLLNRFCESWLETHHKNPDFFITRDWECVAGDTLIYSKCGTVSEIQNLRPGLKIASSYKSLNGVTNETFCDVLQRVRKEPKQLFKIIPIKGLPIRVSSEHGFLTALGWKKAKDLTTDDFLYLSKNKVDVEPFSNIIESIEIKDTASLLRASKTPNSLFYLELKKFFESEFVSEAPYRLGKAIKISYPTDNPFENFIPTLALLLQIRCRIIPTVLEDKSSLIIWDSSFEELRQIGIDVNSPAIGSNKYGDSLSNKEAYDIIKEGFNPFTCLDSVDLVSKITTRHSAQGFELVQIADIIPDEIEVVWDLTTSTEQFVANGIIVHNTTGLDPHTCEGVISSHSWDYNNSVVIQPNNFKLDLYKEAMATIPRNNQNEKFDTKFDIKMLGLKPPIFFDTQHGAQVGYAGILKGYSLDDLQKELLDNYKIDKDIRMDFPSMKSIEVDGINYWVGLTEGNRILEDDHIRYAAQDTIIAHMLCGKILSRLSEENLIQVWEEIERPLIPIFADIEMRGFKADWKFAEDYYKTKEAELTKSYGEIKEITTKLPDEVRANFKNTKLKNSDFSPGSAPQILKLFQHYGVKLKNTKKEYLEEVRNGLIGNEEKSEAFDLLNLILEYKTQSTVFTKFIKPFIANNCNPKTKRIHPDFRIITRDAQTGRSSASNPNLMAVDPVFRAIIVADEGFEIHSRDYSAFEFRAAAGLSGEQAMLDAFIRRADLLPDMLKLSNKYGETDPDTLVKGYTKGKLDLLEAEERLAVDFLKTDVHRNNASYIFKVVAEQVSDEIRSTSKTLGYAVLYGGQASRVQTALAKEGYFYTLDECSEFIRMFYEALPKISEFLQVLRESVLDPGFIKTPLGRKKYFWLPPRWRGDYLEKLADAERQAQNAMQQSSNADATKLSIVRLSRIFLDEFDEKERPWIMFPIHDEIISSVPVHLRDEVFKLIGDVMVECGLLSINGTCPIEVSGKITPCWTK